MKSSINERLNAAIFGSEDPRVKAAIAADEAAAKAAWVRKDAATAAAQVAAAKAAWPEFTWRPAKYYAMPKAVAVGPDGGLIQFEMGGYAPLDRFGAANVVWLDE